MTKSQRQDSTSPAPAQAGEREAFEAWYGIGADLAIDCWTGWQARAALTPAEPYARLAETLTILPDESAVAFSKRLAKSIRSRTPIPAQAGEREALRELVALHDLKESIDRGPVDTDDLSEYQRRKPIVLANARAALASRAAAQAPAKIGADAIKAAVLDSIDWNLVATVYRGGSDKFGRATVLTRWEPDADKLSDGEHKLYARRALASQASEKPCK